MARAHRKALGLAHFLDPREGAPRSTCLCSAAPTTPSPSPPGSSGGWGTGQLQALEWTDPVQCGLGSHPRGGAGRAWWLTAHGHHYLLPPHGGAVGERTAGRHGARRPGPGLPPSGWWRGACAGGRQGRAAGPSSVGRPRGSYSWVGSGEQNTLCVTTPTAWRVAPIHPSLHASCTVMCISPLGFKRSPGESASWAPVSVGPWLRALQAGGQASPATCP